MRTLYFDCGSGAAGDMISASLFELIEDKEGFLNGINSAGIPHVHVSVEPSTKHGVTGTHFKVSIDGKEEEAAQTVSDDTQVSDIHHHHGHHDHHHHTLDDITDLIDSLDIPDKVREDAISVYKLIAEAEGQVHSATPSEVHFHEVGSLDAVADIVSASWLINILDPQLIIASPMNTGSGKVKCAHGILPVPAPATALLLRDIPIYSTDIKGELCTPTGAALIKHFARQFGPLPSIRMESIGYGMGAKDFDTANCLRAILGETDDVIVEEPVFARHPVNQSEEQKKILVNRISRVIGHLESIKRMVENNRDTDEVLIQLSAVESSINSVRRVIIKSHFKHAIKGAIESGGDPHATENVYGLVDKFLKK